LTRMAGAFSPAILSSSRANFRELSYGSTLAIHERKRWGTLVTATCQKRYRLRTLPATMIRALAPFAPLFSKSVWQHVQVLVAGAILAPGRRTVASALRAMGLDQEQRFHHYHRVLREAPHGQAGKRATPLLRFCWSKHSFQRVHSSWAWTRYCGATLGKRFRAKRRLPLPRVRANRHCFVTGLASVP